MFLNGIAAGFIERIDFGEIMADLIIRKGVKRHICADGKYAFVMGAQMHETNSGDDLVRAALQFFQHPVCVSQIARLFKNFALQKNQGVGAEHEGIGNFFGNGARFAVGIKLANFLG